MYKTIMAGLVKVEKVLLAVTMAVILLLTFANVIGRVCFNHSLAFADELVVALFVLISLMGAALCAREDSGLIGLSLISDRLTGKARICQKLVSNMLSILYCAVLAYQGFVRTGSNFLQGEHTFVMHLPRWIFWSFVPICAVFLILHFIENTVDFINASKAKGGAN